MLLRTSNDNDRKHGDNLNFTLYSFICFLSCDVHHHYHHHVQFLFTMLAWVRRVYLIANFHFTLSYSTSCIFNTLRSPRISSSQISLHFFTQLSLSTIPTWQNHLSLPLCMQFLMLTNPKPIYQLARRLSILHCHITHPSYHHRVISSQLCQVLFFHCPGITAMENNTADTCNILPFVSSGKYRNNFPKCLPATSNSSHIEF